MSGRIQGHTMETVAPPCPLRPGLAIKLTVQAQSFIVAFVVRASTLEKRGWRLGRRSPHCTAPPSLPCGWLALAALEFGNRGPHDQACHTSSSARQPSSFPLAHRWRQGQPPYQFSLFFQSCCPLGTTLLSPTALAFGDEFADMSCCAISTTISGTTSHICGVAYIPSLR